MNATTRYLLKLFRATGLLCWSACGAAASVVAAGQPAGLELDPVLLLLSSVISTLAGGTALAIRVNNLLLRQEESGEPQPFVRPWLFAAAHMGGSWMAGVMGFLLGRVNEWGVWTLLLGVLLFSFMGAKAIEAVAERMLGGVRLAPGVAPAGWPGATDQKQ